MKDVFTKPFFHKPFGLKAFLSFFTVMFLVIYLFSTGPKGILAGSTQDKLQELNSQVEQYENEIKRLKAEANTLSNQIAQYDAQINLTTLKIGQTEAKITLLGGRINQLETSLQSLTKAFVSRATRTYKMARLNDPFFLLISARNLSGAVSSYHYLGRIQEADRSLLVQLEEVQGKYEVEKSDLEVLQDQLEGQKLSLSAQKSAKAKLLDVTKSDERRYQQLLVKARAELEAIQSIIAGRGSETEVGRVNESEKVASIIPSASACSSGAHLHFEVVKDGAHQDPANLLIPKSVTWDNDPDPPFNFSGSWRWPLNDPVRITQGYGMTYYASNLHYYGGAPHTGIDMVNKNNFTVKAVKSGTLYQGAIACGGGTLKYVRVKQDDGYDSYFLHVNYY